MMFKCYSCVKQALHQIGNTAAVTFLRIQLRRMPGSLNSQLIDYNERFVKLSRRYRLRPSKMRARYHIRQSCHVVKVYKILVKNKKLVVNNHFGSTKIL